MKKTTTLALTVFIIGLASVSANTAMAYRGDPAVMGPDYSAERHTAMIKAFETKDYTAWKKLMENRGRVTQVVTESNFAKFAEAHDFALQGKIVEAQKVRQELGLGLQNHSRWNRGGMMGVWK